MGALTATHEAKSGHPGGRLSAADVFTYLYFKELSIDPVAPKKADRDCFVLSKALTAPGLYTELAHRGFFPVDDLPTLWHIDSYLQSHPNMKTVADVDMSTASLGQVWEALMLSVRYKLDNFCIIVDHTGFQIDNPNEKVMGLGSIPDKLRTFELDVFQISGYDFQTMEGTFDIVRQTKGKPCAIVLETKESATWRVRWAGTARPPTTRNTPKVWQS